MDMNNFVELLNRKYLEYQNRLGYPIKAKEFAATTIQYPTVIVYNIKRITALCAVLFVCLWVIMNSKQQAFLNEYLIDMNATQAAIRAGYSEASAYSQGQRLLKNDEVKAGIAQKLQDSAMKADEILQKLTDIARADMGDYLDVSSVAFQVDLNKAKEQGKLNLIRKIKQKTTTICREGGEDVEQNQIEFELLDQLKALEMLAKYHGLLVDKHELKTTGPVEIIIKRVDAANTKNTD